jgi:hypothetical protein
MGTARQQAGRAAPRSPQPLGEHAPRSARVYGAAADHCNRAALGCWDRSAPQRCRGYDLRPARPRSISAALQGHQPFLLPARSARPDGSFIDVAAEHYREDLAEPGEGGVRRIAHRLLGIWPHRRHPASGPGQPHYLGAYPHEIKNVNEQRASVHQVEGARQQPGVPGVLGHDSCLASPCAAANCAAVAACAASASKPTTRPPGDTRSAIRPRMPRGPQPRSIARCPGRRPTQSSSAGSMAPILAEPRRKDPR